MRTYIMNKYSDNYLDSYAQYIHWLQHFWRIES